MGKREERKRKRVRKSERGGRIGGEREKEYWKGERIVKSSKETEKKENEE